MNHRAQAGSGRSIPLFFLLATIAIPAARAAQGPLVARDLGTFDGRDSYGDAINDRGQIVGSSFDGQSTNSFLLDSGNRTTDLGHAYVVDINNRGQMLTAGFIANPDDPNSCFLRDGDSSIDLGTPEGSQCFPAALNNQGKAVGTIQTSLPTFPFHVSHAFLWDSGLFVDLGSLGEEYSAAYGINDRGQVVGSHAPDPGVEHAFIWEAGTVTDIHPPSETFSRAYAINNRGQVVIQAGSHVYLWEGGVFTDLTPGRPPISPPTVGGTDDAVYTIPIDMNERGQILVADHQGAAGFVYGIFDAGSFIPLPTLGGGHPSAIHLNNRGEAIGADRVDPAGLVHLVLWSPKASKGRDAR